jgi:hypothetical protein
MITADNFPASVRVHEFMLFMLTKHQYGNFQRLRVEFLISGHAFTLQGM